MEITLEKIELVKDRTGVSYKEAKEALEKTEGNVVDAIILIEDTIDESSNASESKVSEIIETIKGFIKKGNVSKVLVKKGDDVIVNLPVNIGIIGTLVFPWAVIASAIAAFGTKCTVEIVKDNGEVVNVSGKACEAFTVAKSKGGVIFDEVKEKGGDVFEFAKEKGKDVWDNAKDAGMEAWDKTKEKGKDVWDNAKEKASSVINKNNGDIIDVSEFGDLDLSDVDFNELEEDDE